MRLATATAIAFVGALTIVSAQQPPAQPPAGGGQRMGGGMDPARKVPGGGITGAGWQGKVDAGEAKNGSAVNDSKFVASASEIMINSGPASVFWRPADSQSGDFTVSATFTEPQMMSAMGHSHPYGLFIAGNKLETENPTLLYCAAYGEGGRYIVRAFPTSFQVGGSRRPATNAAVKAVAKGEPVTQQISMSVKGSQVTCSINGTAVATMTKDDLVGEGKLESIQGNVGLRISHNVDVKVTEFKVTKQ